MVFGYNEESSSSNNEENKIYEKSNLLSGPMDSPWPMKCHDNRHTGLSPYSTADNPGTEKWRFKTDGCVRGGPVIGNDGTIYVGSWDFYLYAINSDGSLKWKYSTLWKIWSTPAIAEDGTIYVGSWDWKLYAINPNGTLKWKFSTEGAMSSSPAIAGDGAIYFGSMGSGGGKGRVSAVNPDGTEKWYYHTGDAITSDPAIGDDGTVYIGSLDNYLYVLYPNGTLRWRFETQDEVHGHPSIASDGTIYFGSYDDYLYALHPNGTIKWKFYTSWGTCGSPSIGEDGIIYVGTDKLYAIYPDGTLKWSFDPENNRHIGFSSPAISADGTIFVGLDIGSGAGGEILAVNPDGTEKWRSGKIANWCVDSSSCIAEDGTVYIGSSSDRQSEPNDWDSIGYLHAFGPVESNDPPDTPTITGTLNGRINKVQCYWVSTIDPDLNPVSFYVDWGDDTNTGWIGQYGSGEKVYLEHTWSEKGNYTIMVKAKDEFGGESDWATLEVSMPKSSTMFTPFFSILENHPHLFPILRYLMGV